MTYLQSEDGPTYPSQQIERYRQLAFRLLNNKAVATWHGIQGVALGRSGITVLVERDDRLSNRELLRAAGDSRIEVRAIGRVELSGGGGKRIDAASGARGTLGCVVADDQGQQFALTCDHVVGFEAGQSVNDDVYCGLPKLGTFVRGSAIVRSTSASNTTDAALISPSPGVALHRSIAGMPPAPYGSNRFLQLNDDVRKSGDRTGVTSGRFVYIVTMLVPYGNDHARFVDQIGIDGGGTVFSDKGDSGAVLLDSRNRIAGLLFASAPQGCLGFANPIAEVETALGVSPL